MEAYYGIDSMGLVWYSDSGASSVITTSTVNSEIYAKLSFKQPDVRAVYIDWDDGTSNKKTESNYQWVQTTEPVQDIVVSHTYNKSGTFNPVVQSINSDGIVSRYYGKDATNTDVVPYSQLTTVLGMAVSDTSPTAIMRVENTTVNAGIDNSVMEGEGPCSVYFGLAPTLTQAELNTIGQVKVEVEVIVNYSKYISTSSDIVKMGSNESPQTISFDVDLTSSTNKTQNLYSILASTTAPLSNGVAVFGKISRIVKFKYVSAKSYGAASSEANTGTDYTLNALYNKLKMFLVAKSPSTGKFYPICYISSGMPVKSVDTNTRFSTLDFSQSRAAASNSTISNYRFDNGKMWDSYWPVSNWSLSTNILGTATLQSGSVLPVHYSYITPSRGIGTTGAISGKVLFDDDNAQKWYTGAIPIADELILTDDFGRVYDQYYMTRNSVVASSTSGSVITSNQPEVFVVEPSPNFTTSADVATHNPVTDITTPMKNNASGSSFIAGAINSVTEGGTDMFNNPIGYANQDYLILAFDSITNKVFFNMANYAQGMMDDAGAALNALSIGSVEYLRLENSGTKTQHATWKPLIFKDTTKIDKEEWTVASDDYKFYSSSFCKSGYISFDMPLDWGATSITNLCGGVYNTAAGTLSEAISAGTDDIIITGTVTNNGSVSNYGKTSTIVGINTSLAAIGSADDVGAYKYMGILKSGSGVSQPSGAAYWLASGTSVNGWNGETDATSAVTFQYGETGTSAKDSEFWVAPVNSSTVQMIVRRVNMYDVLPGASKVFQDDKNNTTVSAAKIMPVDSNNWRAGSVYFRNRYNATQAGLTGSSWATNSKYLLRIALSGTTGVSSASVAVPQFENVFDGTRGDSAIIKVVDDSAYSLNSLAITSDVSLSRSGHYFKAITRKGKVYISKTGIQLTTFGLSSVALGDESLSSSAMFDNHGPSTLYGHLHTVRRLQAENVPVYWDEPQKDGTFVRIWGSITDVTETRGTGGPKAIVNFSFNITVKEIALIDNTGDLMTDLFPLGGILNDRNYS